MFIPASLFKLAMKNQISRIIGIFIKWSYIGVILLIGLIIFLTYAVFIMVGVIDSDYAMVNFSDSKIGVDL